MSKITEALQKLDHGNDDQWTTDGLPQIAVIKELTGDKSIKRKDITDAAPDFKRNADLDGDDNEDGVDKSEAGHPADPGAAMAEQQQAAFKSAQERAIARSEELSVEIADLQAQRNQIDKRLDALIREQADLSPFVPTPGYNHVEDQKNRMHYIRQQNKIREAAALGRKLQDLGDTSPPKSDLDKSLQDRPRPVPQPLPVQD